MCERKRRIPGPELGEEMQIVALLLSGQSMSVRVRRDALLSDLIWQIRSASLQRVGVVTPVTTLILSQGSGFVRHTLLHDSDRRILDLGYIDGVEVQALVETMPDKDETYLNSVVRRCC